jgi:hypothetical protein
MKRYTTALTILVCLMTVIPVRAEITWLENETEFDYIIDHKSTFYYEPPPIWENPNQYIIKTDAFDSYNAVAEIQYSQFEDIPGPGSGVQIQAKALGPQTGSGPQNGTEPPYILMTQAFLSTVAGGLNAQQGVDIDLEAVSRVIHSFEVDQQEDYSVRLELSGLANFDSFYTNDQDQAFYELDTEVRLEQIVGTGEQMVITLLPGFPVRLDESNRTATVAAQLRSVDEQMRRITYRIKIELELKSRIDNFRFQGFVIAGDVNGNYQVGSPQAPFVLQASIKPGDFIDSDEDGVLDDLDNCPNDSNPDQLDSDDDGVGNVCDDCPDDPLKITPGICGCDVPDTDTDNDSTPDCNDECPSDPLKTDPALCGCGTADTDSDLDTVVDCQDGCPSDPQKTAPGICGCGVADSDVDTDEDSVIDCIDAFPADPDEWEDTDQDGIGNNADEDDDNDEMPDDWEELYGLNPLIDDADEDPDEDGWNNRKEFENGTDPTDPESFPLLTTLSAILNLLLADEISGIVDSDSDGVPDDSDNCPDDANAEQLDSDDDGIGNACDECPDDPDKSSAGGCGCGVPDIDTDGDGVLDCDEIDCSELPEDGCPLPPPSAFAVTIDTSTVPGQTYVEFTWSEVNCAEGYLLAIGRVNDLNSAYTFSTVKPSFRANFSSAPAGSTYYWAVATRCNLYSNEAGEWSDIQTYEFTP